jgi:hypothetical protein
LNGWIHGRNGCPFPILRPRDGAQDEPSDTTDQAKPHGSHCGLLRRAESDEAGFVISVRESDETADESSRNQTEPESLKSLVL